MERKAKVELFEQIRRDFEFEKASVRSIAQKYGVHRRMVRQAIESAMPPARKERHYARPALEPVMQFINQILESDLKAPRKQRHTAHRIYERVLEELAEVKISERSVRKYVQERKQQLGVGRQEVFIPQSYELGQEGQIDWYTATAIIGGVEQTVQMFTMRSMASGGAFHRAYPRATQQAFFDGHEHAFRYFEGVFKTLRYDNLASAVRRVFKGHQREQNARASLGFARTGSSWRSFAIRHMAMKKEVWKVKWADFAGSIWCRCPRWPTSRS
jgi:transposase